MGNQATEDVSWKWLTREIATRLQANPKSAEESADVLDRKLRAQSTRRSDQPVRMGKGNVDSMALLVAGWAQILPRMGASTRKC